MNNREENEAWGKRREKMKKKKKKDSRPEEKSVDQVQSEAGHSIPRWSWSPITEQEPVRRDTPFLSILWSYRPTYTKITASAHRAKR